MRILSFLLLMVFSIFSLDSRATVSADDLDTAELESLLDSQEDSDDDFSDDHGSRVYECSARDHGWEEHWGGHAGYSRNLYMAQRLALSHCQR
jgi:hypothetical protein